MATYKVFLYNVLTQNVITEIPFAALSYSYVMDEPGTAEIEIPMTALKTDGNPLTPDDVFPVRTGIAIQRDSELVWGGLLWAYRADLAKRTLSLSAQGYLSYYRYRHTATAGVKYKNLEQTTMIKNFIDSIAANGIKTLTSGLVATNMVRTRAWNPYEFKNLAEVFADLADDITSKDTVTGIYGGGFFFYLEPYWITTGTKVGNRIRNTANRHPYSSGKNLQQGVNCEFADISVDGTGLASSAFAVGATDGTASITPYAADSNTALSAQIPQVNVVLNETGTKEAVALQYKVRSALAFGSKPVILPKADTYPDLFSPLALQPGMSTSVTSDDGFLSLLAEEYVITETAVSVAPDGSDRLSLSLVQADLFKETEN
ncbi:minor tail protein [Streptomyces phage Shady]|uniref:Minor tail protein n=1 Tax=Streptomyces phage Shady TaxID=2767585 RepID=A0A873WJU5_9CAUD|nr:minor tail protein [Streptomyces phage Shady]